MGVAFHGADRAAQGRSGVGLGQVGQVAQHQDLTLASRKGGQQVGDQQTIDRSTIRGLSCDRRPVGTRRVTTVSQQIERQVRGHPGHPRLGMRRDPAPADAGSGDRLLGDVLRLGAITEQSEGHPIGDGREPDERVVERWRR